MKRILLAAICCGTVLTGCTTVMTGEQYLEMGPRRTHAWGGIVSERVEGEWIVGRYTIDGTFLRDFKVRRSEVDPAVKEKTWKRFMDADRAETEVQEKLDGMRPWQKGLGVMSNGDGTCSVRAYGPDTPDLSTLKGLPVRSVEIVACPELKDISPLAGLPLESLKLYKTGVEDLSPLKHTRLKRLSITGSRVTDLSPLRNLPLTVLRLFCAPVSDISPLKGMGLKHLNIQVNEWVRITDVSPLEGMKLESLAFHENCVTEGLDAVRRMKTLKKINGKTPEEFWKEYEAEGPVRERLRKAGVKFTRLGVCRNGTYILWFHGDDVTDLTPLKGMPIAYLGFRESKVADLRPLAGMPLDHLYIESSALTDVSPVRELHALTDLYLVCDRLSDVSLLKGMKLETLRLQCPKVTDISALRELPVKHLGIKRCGVTDLSVLEGMAIEFFEFDPERVTKGIEVLRRMKTVEQINYYDAKIFWGKYDAGEFAKVKRNDAEQRAEGDSADRAP